MPAAQPLACPLPAPTPRHLPAPLAVALLVVAAPLAVLFLLPPLAQPAAYHAFADTRTWHGLPNALAVLTNLPFLLAALACTAVVAMIHFRRSFITIHK